MEIKYDSYLDSLQYDDVIEQSAISKGKQYYAEKLLKIGKIKENFNSTINSVIPSVICQQLESSFNIASYLFYEGLKCRILKANAGGWRSGKIKINVSVNIEFIPDKPEITEPESPLDEIRREISQLKQES